MNGAKLRESEVDHGVEENRPSRTLIYLFKDQNWRFVLAFIFFCIKHSPVWLIPLLTANIVDILVTHQPIRNLYISIAILLFVTVNNWPFNILYVRFQSRAIREVENKLRSALVERMQQLSMGFYLRTNAGILQTKIVRDVENIEQMVRNLSDGGFVAINGIVGTLVITAIKVPVFLPFFFLLGPIVAIFVAGVRRKLNIRNDEFRAEIESMSGRVNEMTTLMPITRAHGLEKWALEVMSNSFTNVRRAGLNLDSFNAKFGAMAWVLLQFANVTCLAVSGYCAYSHKAGVTTGDVVLLTSLFSQLTGSLTLMFSLMPQISRGFTSIKSIGEVLNSPDLEHNDGKLKMSEITGVVVFEKVTFTYPGVTNAAINDVSVSANPGEMIALVGPSGAGKSTFINLLIGFLPPQAGRILIDGHDTAEYDLRTIRRFISVVPQESVLIDGTVFENVSYGLHGVSQERMRAALVAANAWGFVSELPYGVETIIGERGARISGGQKQRLAIARALIRDPQILILDEATSALDSESEKEIQKAFVTLMANRTTFVVAHRLSTVQKADVILVLDRGKVVERGQHSDLSHAGGVYQRLFEAQTFNGESNR